MNDEFAGGAGGGQGQGPRDEQPGEEPTRHMRDVGSEEEPTRQMPGAGPVEEPTRQMRTPAPPLGGPSIPAGSGVVLGVSTGQPSGPRTTKVVPSVLGMRQDAALVDLQSAGFGVEVLRNPSSTVTTGMVSHQYPAANAVATTGSRIAIIVSAGPAPEAARMTVLPDVVGRTEDAAVAALAQAGLRSAIVNDFNAAVSSGVVMAQEPNSSDVRAYVEEKKGGKAWLWILLAVIALLIAAAAVYFLTAGGDEVSVPGVTGQTVAEAEATLTEAGLELGTVTERANSEVTAGEIVEQDPKAGQMVEEGTRINVIVAAAPAGVEVPDVTGSSIAKAKSDLAEVGLTWRVSEAYDNDVDVDDVIRQSPQAGTRVDEGAEIALTVSLGTEPARNAIVPNVVGVTADEAAQALQDAGLEFETVGVYTDGVDKDEVGAQSPGAGASVAPGTTILLAVSLGPLPDDATAVEVPNVVGMTEQEATTALQAAGFAVKVYQQSSDTAEGDVFWQFPEPGTGEPQGSSVAIVVSTGA